MASKRSTVDNRTTAFLVPPFPCVYLFFLVIAWVPDDAEIEEDRGLDKGGRSTTGRRRVAFVFFVRVSKVQLRRGGLFTLFVRRDDVYGIELSAQRPLIAVVGMYGRVSVEYDKTSTNLVYNPPLSGASDDG